MPYSDTPAIGVDRFQHRWVLCVCFVIALFASAPAKPQSSTDPGAILFLFDTSFATAWKSSFVGEFRRTLSAAGGDFGLIRYSYEFLGLQDYLPDIPPSALVELLKFKQQGDPVSMVIGLSAINETTNFLSSYGDEIYPGVPVIHVSPLGGIQATPDSLTAASVQVTASASDLVIERTLALIPDLLPGMENLYVISGSSDTDRDFLSVAETYLGQLAASIEVVHLESLEPSALMERTAELPDNSAIFLVSYAVNADGTNPLPDNFLPELAAATNVPIFTSFNSMFRNGVLGGNFTAPQRTGRSAATVALSLLTGGEPDASMPPETAYRFDQLQIDRWGINESLLPPDSEILNQQSGFIELYFEQLAIVLAAFCGLLGLVVYLKRQATREGNQKTLFESVINSIPDAIVLSDKEARIFAANRGAERVFGFSHDELLGANMSILSDGFGGDEAGSKAVVPLLNSREPLQLTCRKQNGSFFTGEALGTQIISADGSMLGYFVLLRDISKRISLEQENRQGQKMEALGNLVGGISHDFNNVLGVISGYAELSLADDGNNPIRDHLNKILKATDRGKSLVNQITSFSRDTSSAMKPIELAKVLEDTAKLINVSIPASIEVSMQLEPGVRPILGSEVQIEQIIMNLVTNAYQAMPEGEGSITTSLTRKVLSEGSNLSHGVLAPGNYSVLTISDTGPGMSKEIANRIFEPFFTTKEQGKGSGMGMAIVYKLIRSHGALLDLQTAPGEGTSISLYFEELEDESAKSDAGEKLPIVEGRGQTILLVDDESDLLDSARQLLSGIGYAVEAYSDPAEALESFRKSPGKYDLLVSDENMPKISGTKLLQAIRAIKSDIPAVICTGYGQEFDRRELENLRLGGVVKKPFTLEEISSTIGSVLAA